MTVVAERWLQYGVAAMGVLATTMLGMGESNAVLPALAVVMALGSLHLTDRRGWIQIAPQQAAWLGAAAVALAAFEFGRFARETWLLALANLLVYLQFILLFHRKVERLYWQLIVLSLMQAAVSTALNFSVLFACLLLAYMAIGLAVLALMHLYALQGRFGFAAPALRDGAAAEQPAPVAAGRLAAAFDPAAEFPLAAAQHWGYWWQITVVGAASLVLTSALFLAVPRLRKQQWLPAGGVSTVQVTGATDTVKLGDIGTVMESTQAVMQVRLSNFKRQPQTYALIDEPYFRGVVLSEYERGKWHRLAETDYSGRMISPLEVNDLPWASDLVLQQITLEPLDTPTLYCLYPMYCVSETGPLFWNDGAHFLARREAQQTGKFSYELVTSGLQQGKQVPYTPIIGFERRDLRRLTQLPTQPSLSRLAALAEETVAGLPVDQVLPRAKALLELLRFKGRYSYSLVLDQQDPSLDPVEDFLVNTRQGHCEYFASALTLMLRSQGMAARMIVGFKGGDFNRFGAFYQVRQLNSHAWVEVYVPPEQLPEGLPAPAELWGRGAWLRLDPTPADPTVEQAATVRYTLGQLRQGADFLRYLWSNYVLGLDAQRQQAAVYGPLTQGLREAAAWLTDVENWRSFGRRVWQFLRAERFGWLGGEWFNWRAGAAASGMSLVIALAARWLRPRLAGLVARTRLGRLMTVTHDPAEVQLYRHYEAMLARHGLTRPPSTTQREFAERLSHELSRQPHTLDVERVPHRVVQFFYDVRFGARPLDKLQLQQVEQAVAQLEAALASAPQPRALSV